MATIHGSRGSPPRHASPQARRHQGGTDVDRSTQSHRPTAVIEPQDHDPTQANFLPPRSGGATGSLVRAELANTGAQYYQRAAARLARMRKLAKGSAEQPLIDGLIAELRQEHKRRPRLQQEFTRARLP